MKETKFLVTVESEVTEFGKERPFVRLVKLSDMEEFLDAFVGKGDYVELKVVTEYKE